MADIEFSEVNDPDSFDPIRLPLRDIEWVYTLRDGEDWRMIGGAIVICGPHEPPFIVDLDGSKRPLVSQQ